LKYFILFKGDITPDSNISSKDKMAAETAAMDKFQTILGFSPASIQIRELWDEYEKRSSPEALVVKDLDRFEMVLQADEYERRMYDRDTLSILFFYLYLKKY